jgi:nucleoside-diphosphate-sugar epimerase
MRILVAGATGAIGRHLVPQLVAAGHDVTGLTRTPAKADALRALGARRAVADALDGAAVATVVAEAEPEVIVHELTALPAALDMRRFDREFATTNRLRTEGTRLLLDAGRAAGLRRFVAQSYCGWPYARTGGPVKTEEDPLDPRPARAMRESSEAIRTLERLVTGTPGIDGVVLRYGGLYGPDTSLAADGEMTEAIRAGRFPVVGGGGGVWSFVHVDDAAAATLAAVEGGAPGVYNVVDDDPAPVSEWLPAMAAALGARAPRRVPRLVGRLLAGEAPTMVMTEVRGGSNAKARRELGWAPRHSWRTAFAEPVAA